MSSRRSLSTLWRDNRSLLLFLFLMLGFRSAWADWMQVPTGSMNPTIIEGDRILVDKHVYGLRVPLTRLRLTRGTDPARGEIVVFDSPKDGTTLVKRLVAGPGDTVELAGEQLVVNGIPARYEPGDTAVLRALLRETQAQSPRVLRESDVDRPHAMLLLPERLSAQQVGPWVIPPGHYFMLGDNRDNSADSRYFGLVPRQNIYGRATRVVASLDPDRHFLPRADRVWRPLE